MEVVQKTKSLLKPANGKPKLNSSITNQSSREEGPPTKKPKVKEESPSSSSDSSSSEDENVSDAAAGSGPLLESVFAGYDVAAALGVSRTSEAIAQTMGAGAPCL